MGLEIVEWAASWPLVLSYFDGRVPAGFPSPAEHEIDSSGKRGAELGLNSEEMAFYTALAENGSARELMRVEDLRVLAQQLVLQIRKSQTIDWTRKESVRAKMRLEVRKLLARYGYPPDLQKAAIDLVLEQAEGLADDVLWT